MKKLFSLLLLFGCNSKETAQQRAEDAVKSYILQNANEPSSYKSIAFGRLDSTYIIDSVRYDELEVKRKEIVTRYNEANRLQLVSKANSLQAELVEINREMDESRNLTGLKIFHVSEGKNTLGRQAVNRGSFYLDSNFEVKEFVMSEDSLEREKNAAITF
jgi:hypothetical protein